MKPAVIKSRFEPNTWLVVSSRGVDLFDYWNDALHYAHVIARVDRGKALRARIDELMRGIQ